MHLDPAARRGHLIAHDLVAGTDDFKAIACRHITSGFDADLLLRACPVGILQRLVEGDAKFIRRSGPGQNRLRCLLVGMANAENLPRARRTRAPVGRATVTGEQQIALRRDACIHEQHGERADEMILRDVAFGRLYELGAIEFAARFAAEQRVTTPRSGTKTRPSVHAFVEDHPDRALMLRAVFKDRRLINDLRQMLRMTRRKAVVQSGLDVQQFVEWISVRQPRRALLLAGEKIAQPVEGQRAGEARAGANGLAFLEVRRDTLDRAVLQRGSIPGLSRGRVHKISVGVIRRAEAEVDRAVLRVHRDADGIHTRGNLRPALGNNNLLVRHAIAVLVENQRNLAFARDDDAIAPRITLGQQRHADWATQ